MIRRKAGPTMSSTRVTFLVVLAAAIASLFATPVHAATDEAEGRKRYKRGQELFLQGKFLKALRINLLPHWHTRPCLIMKMHPTRMQRLILSSMQSHSIISIKSFLFLQTLESLYLESLKLQRPKLITMLL